MLLSCTEFMSWIWSSWLQSSVFWSTAFIPYSHCFLGLRRCSEWYLKWWEIYKSWHSRLVTTEPEVLPLWSVIPQKTISKADEKNCAYHIWPVIYFSWPVHLSVGGFLTSTSRDGGWNKIFFIASYCFDIREAMKTRCSGRHYNWVAHPFDVLPALSSFHTKAGGEAMVAEMRRFTSYYFPIYENCGKWKRDGLLLQGAIRGLQLLSWFGSCRCPHSTFLDDRKASAISLLKNVKSLFSFWTTLKFQLETLKIRESCFLISSAFDYWLTRPSLALRTSKPFSTHRSATSHEFNVSLASVEDAFSGSALYVNFTESEGSSHPNELFSADASVLSWKAGIKT